ncbi:MAG: hypothetical protein WC308_00985 [archaeon]|jgi:hypothetical protein
MLRRLKRIIKNTAIRITGKTHHQSNPVILVREDGAMIHVPKEIAASRMNAGFAPLESKEAKRRMGGINQ